jgi:hypothetical protein
MDIRQGSGEMSRGAMARLERGKLRKRVIHRFPAPKSKQRHPGQILNSAANDGRVVEKRIDTQQSRASDQPGETSG